MSALLMGRVFYLPDLDGSHKLVLLALADHADDNGQNCYPVMDTLAKKASLTVRRVRQIVAELETAGLVRRHINAAAGSRGQIPVDKRPNDYELSIPDYSPRGAMGFLPVEGGGKPASGAGGSGLPPAGGSGLPPEPSLGTTKGTTTASPGSVSSSEPSAAGVGAAAKEKGTHSSEPRQPASPRSRKARGSTVHPLDAIVGPEAAAPGPAAPTPDQVEGVMDGVGCDEDNARWLFAEAKRRGKKDPVAYAQSPGGALGMRAWLAAEFPTPVYNPADLWKD